MVDPFGNRALDRALLDKRAEMALHEIVGIHLQQEPQVVGGARTALVEDPPDGVPQLPLPGTLAQPEDLSAQALRQLRESVGPRPRGQAGNGGGIGRRRFCGAAGRGVFPGPFRFGRFWLGRVRLRRFLSGNLACRRSRPGGSRRMAARRRIRSIGGFVPDRRTVSSGCTRFVRRRARRCSGSGSGSFPGSGRSDSGGRSPRPRSGVYTGRRSTSRPMPTSTSAERRSRRLPSARWAATSRPRLPGGKVRSNRALNRSAAPRNAWATLAALRSVSAVRRSAGPLFFRSQRYPSRTPFARYGTQSHRARSRGRGFASHPRMRSRPRGSSGGGSSAGAGSPRRLSPCTRGERIGAGDPFTACYSTFLSDLSVTYMCELLA